MKLVKILSSYERREPKCLRQSTTELLSPSDTVWAREASIAAQSYDLSKLPKSTSRSHLCLPDLAPLKTTLSPPSLPASTCVLLPSTAKHHEPPIQTPFRPAHLIPSDLNSAPYLIQQCAVNDSSFISFDGW